MSIGQDTEDVQMNLILISLAVASIAITVTKSSLFSKFRKLVTWKLFRCPFCLSHWVAALLCFYYNIFNFVDIFAVVTLSSFSSYLLLFFLEKSDE